MASTEHAPAGCPPEIWAEFSKAIDVYVANWEKELRAHIELADHHEKFEAEWDESKHPRDEAGKFTDGGGDAWIASLKEHPVFGEKTGTFMQHAESLKPLANQVSFEGLRIGHPPDMGTPDSERYKYFEKLNQIASRMEQNPSEAQRWADLIKDRGAEKVAVALIADKHIVGQNPADIRLALDAKGNYIDQMKMAPDPMSNMRLERTVLAYALEHNLSPHELMDQLGGARAYSSNQYREMNAAQREGRPPDPSAVHAIAAFGRLLAAAPDMKSQPGDDIWRGVRLHRLKAKEFADTLLTKGAEFTEKGFISSSASLDFVNGWLRSKTTEDDGDPSKFYFKLQWKNVGGAKNVTAFHALGMTEGEVNYRPGQRFRVRDVLKDGWNHWTIKLEHLR